MCPVPRLEELISIDLEAFEVVACLNDPFLGVYLQAKGIRRRLRRLLGASQR
jgi:hypothetical protein